MYLPSTDIYIDGLDSLDGNRGRIEPSIFFTFWCLFIIPISGRVSISIIIIKIVSVRVLCWQSWKLTLAIEQKGSVGNSGLYIRNLAPGIALQKDPEE